MGDLTRDDGERIDRGDGLLLAVRVRDGSDPAILFLPGYGSDMTGDKASALDAWAAREGRAMIRFDYSGCGESEGRFEDGTLARWRDDALAMLDAWGRDVVIVGSSMGGWLMLLVALARPDRVRALIGIAAAPDFTDWGFDDGEKRAFLDRGETRLRGNERVTAAFWRSGQASLLTRTPIPIDVPVRLLHGEEDDVVPPALSTRVAALLRSADVHTVFVKGGDHRLSRPRDLTLLIRTVGHLLEDL